MKRLHLILLTAAVLFAALLLLFPRKDGRVFGQESVREEKGAGGPRDVSLRGRVVFGEKGIPIEGVLVLLMRGMGEKGRTLTGADGGFAFSVPPNEAWTLCAQPWGECWPVEREVPVDGGAPQFMEIPVPDTVVLSFSGTVSGPDGRPLAGATVSARYGENGVEEGTKTLGDGSYRIPRFVARLAKPIPRPTLSDEIQVWFWRDRNDLRNVRVAFSHPSFPVGTQEVSIGLEPSTCDRVDYQFGECVVSGTVKVPPGGTVEGKRFPFSVAPCEDMSWSFKSLPVAGSRFVLRARHEGTMQIGPGFVGEFWLDAVQVGKVGPGVTREGLELDLVSVPRQTLELANLDGSPIDPGSVQATAFFSAFAPNRCCVLPVENGRLRVPLFPGQKGRLHLAGWGFFHREVEIVPGAAFAAVRLDSFPPILTGRIEFPLGFDGREKVRLALRATEDGKPVPKDWSFFSLRGDGAGGSWIDPGTGEFRILSYKPGGCIANQPPEDISYSVAIAIPEYRPWKMDKVPMKRNQPTRSVIVRFEK